jgi:hypothetical protein
MQCGWRSGGACAEQALHQAPSEPAPPRTPPDCPAAAAGVGEPQRRRRPPLPWLHHSKLYPSPFASAKLPTGGWPIYLMDRVVPAPWEPGVPAQPGEKALKPISVGKPAKASPSGSRSGRGLTAFFSRKKLCTTE